MPATEKVSEIVDRVKKRLDEARSERIFLKVTGAKLDDDWLYITVAPSQPGGSASEQAAFMSRIERELRNAGDNNILLVPALDD